MDYIVTKLTFDAIFPGGKQNMFERDEQRTLMIVKPDGVQRGLVGEVISRVERRGLKIVGLKMVWMDKELAKKHYAVHDGKDFFDKLIKFITSSPVVLIAVQGYHAVNLVRRMMGALDPDEADRGSIRGDLAMSRSFNVVHGSDTPENGEAEIALHFSQKEIFDYSRSIDDWLKND
jgi:nucleoside-diphosphate kinase